MSSRDGVTWENDVAWVENGGDDDYCLFGVAYGKGRFVAVGGATKIGHVLITRDGKKCGGLRRAGVCEEIGGGKPSLRNAGALRTDNLDPRKNNPCA